MLLKILKKVFKEKIHDRVQSQKSDLLLTPDRDVFPKKRTFLYAMSGYFFVFENVYILDSCILVDQCIASQTDDIYRKNVNSFPQNFFCYLF